MALTINGKKVLGYALGENEYLDGTGIESLNIFIINSEVLANVDHKSFTIDMTKYFNQADAKYSDVKYYQIILELTFTGMDGTNLYEKFLTPLLKRGEINNPRNGTNVSGNGAISVSFTDKNKLNVYTKCPLDEIPVYRYQNTILRVYGFTSQDVGSVS